MPEAMSCSVHFGQAGRQATPTLLQGPCGRLPACHLPQVVQPSHQSVFDRLQEGRIIVQARLQDPVYGLFKVPLC
jgi:hypothetical protein